MNKIKLPPEFRSGNSIPVERATISRERMVEILKEAIEAIQYERNDLWKQAIDHELVTFGSTADSYLSPKEAIEALIDWNISLATDPKVNGGHKLVPIEPTEDQ